MVSDHPAVIKDQASPVSRHASVVQLLLTCYRAAKSVLRDQLLSSSGWVPSAVGLPHRHPDARSRSGKSWAFAANRKGGDHVTRRAPESWLLGPSLGPLHSRARTSDRRCPQPGRFYMVHQQNDPVSSTLASGVVCRSARARLSGRAGCCEGSLNRQDANRIPPAAGDSSARSHGIAPTRG